MSVCLVGFKGTLFSSASNEWVTPQPLFDALNAEFGFDLDAAASPANAKCEAFLTCDDDALSVPWHTRASSVWLNPPYGRGIGRWVQKAYDESRQGCRVVVLVMARCDTRWWHQWATRAAEIRFIHGRIWFLQGAKSVSAAPAPSAVLVFDEDLRRPVVTHVTLPRREP